MKTSDVRTSAMASKGQIFVWILCLAFLSVGARNFELGMSIDAPLYAAIGRNIARTHEWFFLYGGVPDFVPFAEHPHFGFWLIALVFSALPAADWSARIPGQLCYVAFLFLLFVYVRRQSGERTAVGSVLLLWIWYRFSNYFSSVYLDPPALLFGSFAMVASHISLERGSFLLATLAGLSLALAAMTKGLMVAGFLPAIGVLFLVFAQRLPRARWFALAATLALSFAVSWGAYVTALQHSSVPNFLALYWGRQVTQRFGVIWSFWGLLDWSFWERMLRDTLYLLPLALLGLPRRRADIEAKVVPLVTLLTFIVLYAPNGRTGNQYWLTIFPWIAWLIADGVLNRGNWNPLKVMRVSGTIAVAAVLVIQYLPFPTHSLRTPGELREIAELKDQGKRVLILDRTPEGKVEFITGAAYSWYADVETRYAGPEDAVGPPALEEMYLLRGNDPARSRELRERGWCEYRKTDVITLWAGCAGGKG